jgi:hypothetical protein
VKNQSKIVINVNGVESDDIDLIGSIEVPVIGNTTITLERDHMGNISVKLVETKVDESFSLLLTKLEAACNLLHGSASTVASDSQVVNNTLFEIRRFIDAND